MTHVLEARGIVRNYGTVEALRGADFTVNAGEVTALIGDNGAGKSTLVRILSGTEAPDDGLIFIEGKEVKFATPIDAREVGIETVFQDLALCPHLSPVQNLFLGREIPRKGLLGKFGFLDNEKMKKISADAFKDLGATVRSLTANVGSMSGGQRQSIAVARSAAWANKVLFFDEPTAALGVKESAHVLRIILQAKLRGIAVILITHNVTHALTVGDHFAVLIHGEKADDFRKGERTREQITDLMAGGEAMDELEKELDHLTKSHKK